MKIQITLPLLHFRTVKISGMAFQNLRNPLSAIMSFQMTKFFHHFLAKLFHRQTLPLKSASLWIKWISQLLKSIHCSLPKCSFSSVKLHISWVLLFLQMTWVEQILKRIAEKLTLENCHVMALIVWFIMNFKISPVIGGCGKYLKLPLLSSHLKILCLIWKLLCN